MHTGSLGAVNSRRDGGGLDAGLSDDLGAVGSCVLDRAGGGDVEVTASAEVVHLSDVPLGLDGLASAQGLELLDVHHGGVDEDLQSTECNILA